MWQKRIPPPIKTTVNSFVFPLKTCLFSYFFLFQSPQNHICLILSPSFQFGYVAFMQMFAKRNFSVCLCLPFSFFLLQSVSNLSFFWNPFLFLPIFLPFYVIKLYLILIDSWIWFQIGHLKYSTVRKISRCFFFEVYSKNVDNILLKSRLKNRFKFNLQA